MVRGSFLVAAIGLVIGTVAVRCHAAGTLLLPIHDGNGNVKNDPITTDLGMGGAFSLCGIGLKSASNMPDTLPIPNTAPEPVSLLVTNGGIVPATFVYLVNGSTLTVNGTGVVGGNVMVEDSSVFTMNSGSIGTKPGPAELEGEGQSHVTVNGGTVAGGLVAAEDSVVTFTGGNVDSLFSESGTINMSGGSVTNGATATGDGLVNITTAATLTGLTASNFGTILMNSGGTVGIVSVNDKSQIFLGGVTVGGGFSADNGTISMTGGSIVGNVGASNGADVLISTGSIGGNVGCSSSLINLTTGAILGKVSSSGTSSMTMSVGTCGSVAATDHSEIFIIGPTTINSGSVSVLGNATITLSGAVTVNGPVKGAGFGTIKLNTGAVVNGTLTASETSSIFMNDGSITGNLVTSGGAQIAMLFGTVSGGLDASNSSNYIMGDGVVDGGMIIRNIATAWLFGGEISGNIFALNSSNVSIAKCIINDSVFAQQDSTVFINGATILGSVFASGTAHVTINGTVGNIKPTTKVHPDSATLLQIYLDGDSTLEFDGHSLTANLLNPNDADGYREYGFSGLFADGTPVPSYLTLYVANGSNAAFQLVEAPEPTSATLLLMGLCLGRPFHRGRVKQAPKGKRT